MSEFIQKTQKNLLEAIDFQLKSNYKIQPLLLQEFITNEGQINELIKDYVEDETIQKQVNKETTLLKNKLICQLLEREGNNNYEEFLLDLAIQKYQEGINFIDNKVVSNSILIYNLHQTKRFYFFRNSFLISFLEGRKRHNQINRKYRLKNEQS